MASARDIIRAGNPPRTVFVDYPLGHTTGKPHDPADQAAVLRAALAAFPRFSGPGEIIDLGHRWAEDEGWREQAGRDIGDQRQPRDLTPRYQTEEDRRLAEAALSSP